MIADTSTIQGNYEGGNVVDPFPNCDSDLSPALWPSDTDLVSTLGAIRLTLTTQHRPVHNIVQDAFEKIRSFLFFNHSFPDPVTIPDAVRDCLIAVAEESHDSMAPDVLSQLTQDSVYMDKLSYLVGVF